MKHVLTVHSGQKNTATAACGRSPPLASLPCEASPHQIGNQVCVNKG